MPLLTNGFNTDEERFDHWDRHHEEFEPPPMTESDYEERADAFLAGPKLARVLECLKTMPNGRTRRFRYDPVTNEYGALSGDGRIVTYFKPGHRNPLAYYHRNC